MCARCGTLSARVYESSEPIYRVWTAVAFVRAVYERVDGVRERTASPGDDRTNTAQGFPGAFYDDGHLTGSRIIVRQRRRDEPRESSPAEDDQTGVFALLNSGYVPHSICR